MIVWGHPPDVVWSYTPRQLFRYFDLAVDRVGAERAAHLAIVAAGSRGEERAVRQQIAEWGSDA